MTNNNPSLPLELNNSDLCFVYIQYFPFKNNKWSQRLQDLCLQGLFDETDHKMISCFQYVYSFYSYFQPEVENLKT